MSMQQNNTNYGGIGFVGLLTLVFITLKLTGVITWSWWWVLSPILIVWGLLLGIIVLFLALSAWTSKRRW